MKIEFQSINLNGKEARFLQFEQNGAPVHFYPANGFPLGAYSQFLKPIAAQYSLSCLSLRACWPNIESPPLQTNWQVYADDLITFIEQHYTEPIIGIGHSQGASSTILAAAQRPDLFKSLIVIEPASVTKAFNLMLRMVPYAIKKTQQPIKSALVKQEVWESREAFFEHCRQNRAYKRISDSVLRDFATYGLKPLDDGRFTLTFSKEWEASNYAVAASIWKYLKKIDLPIKVIAGKPSLFFTEKIREKWQRLSPNSSIQVNTNFGHLFPLEAPEICAEMVL